MRRSFIGLMLCSLMLAGSAYAKGAKIFDLKEQYFSETLMKKDKKEYHEAKYDVSNVYVTTDAKFNGSSYMFGLFTVDVKEPIAHWNVNIKKKNGSLTGGETTVIRLTSDIGNSYFISFGGVGNSSKGVIRINEKEFAIDSFKKQQFTVTISKTQDTVKFSINGKGFLKLDGKGFGDLAKIEVELNDNYNDDELSALDIYRTD